MIDRESAIESLALSAELRARVMDADRRVREAPDGWQSLDPDARQAASPGGILVQLAPLKEEDAHWIDFLCAYTLSLRRHFPENLFCDLAGLARATRGGDSKLYTALLELNRLYGCEGPIRFRYVHDFLYGWDWVKWLRRSSQTPQTAPPFCMPFLDHLLSRAEEIRQALVEKHEDWEELSPGSFRNPFPYSRDRGAEARLLREAARRNLVPVRTWSQALHDADLLQRDWHAEREALARELDLG